MYPTKQSEDIKREFRGTLYGNMNNKEAEERSKWRGGKKISNNFIESRYSRGKWKVRKEMEEMLV